MKALEIQATADTPKVILDKDKNYFEISGLSLPEDAIEFYKPIMAWLEDYADDPNSDTVFNLKLEYFNTASSKQIIQLLLFLEKLNSKTNVKIRWHYKDIDEDMHDLGEEYSEIIKVNFDLVEYT
ncbi:MAG: DUF1987 domain-containing protein [Bacteroidales bacterium]|nr:DUF1987 domain-containing protein [Bacteroidales bacterium]